MRIDAFEPPHAFCGRTEEMLEKLRTAPRLPRQEPLTFAGEQEWAVAEVRRAK